MGQFAHTSSGQNILFSPEVLVGDRSVSYQHLQRIELNLKWSYQNTFIIDNEYASDNNRIYFFRNSISYHHSNKWRTNLAFGLKNPGLFSTISWTYLNKDNQHSFFYSVGFTYQNGISIEQSMLYRKELIRIQKYTLYYQVFAVANIDVHGYTRGLQQLRIGFQKEAIQFGFGLNFDQFNNGNKTLVNQGGYIKLLIHKSYNYEK